MQWSDDPGGGFTSGQSWQDFQENFRDVNVAAQIADPDSLLNHYRRLIHLHTAHPALGHGDFIPLETESRSVIGFIRGTPDRAALVLINFGDEPATDAVFSSEPSNLAAGVYEASALMGNLSLAPIEVASNGAIVETGPLPTLAPLTGYVLAVSQVPAAGSDG